MVCDGDDQELPCEPTSYDLVSSRWGRGYFHCGTATVKTIWRWHCCMTVLRLKCIVLVYICEAAATCRLWAVVQQEYGKIGFLLMMLPLLMGVKSSIYFFIFPHTRMINCVH